MNSVFFSLLFPSITGVVFLSTKQHCRSIVPDDIYSYNTELMTEGWCEIPGNKMLSRAIDRKFHKRNLKLLH